MYQVLILGRESGKHKVNAFYVRHKGVVNRVCKACTGGSDTTPFLQALCLCAFTVVENGGVHNIFGVTDPQFCISPGHSG